LTWGFLDLRRYFTPHPPQSIVKLRYSDSSNVILLTHGFTGNIADSWDGFYQRIIAEPALSDWDVLGLAYPSSGTVDTVAVYAGDPSLRVLAISLSTTLKLPPLSQYSKVAVAAHSMGGLFVQRALVDDENVRKRVTNLFLYGTPSGGTYKSLLFSPFKKQARDMLPTSSFVTDLRRDWNRAFVNGTPFSFLSIAGDVDEFVPADSSIFPFDQRNVAVVAGDHSTIVKPTEGNAQGVDLLIGTLTGSALLPSTSDVARFDLEKKEYQAVVDLLLPNAGTIDEAALSSLAMALDGLGRGPDALEILERHYRGGEIKSSEALGILAGRVKRRWLVERQLTDLARAVELYTAGYQGAAAADDHEQGYYHAINLAFLSLMATPQNTKEPPEVRRWAEQAIWHCARSPDTNWRTATKAEAELLLHHKETAFGLYKEAVRGTNSNRQLGSMYSQAARIADRTLGGGGLSEIKAIFDRYQD